MHISKIRQDSGTITFIRITRKKLSFLVSNAMQPSIYSTPKGGAEHLKVNTAQRVREGSKEHDTDGWSSWDDRESGTGKSRSKSPKLATPSGSNSSLCSPSPGSSSGVLEEAKGKGSEGSSPRGGGKGEAMTGKSSSGGGTPLASSTPSKPASQGPSGKSQVCIVDVL